MAEAHVLEFKPQTMDDVFQGGDIEYKRIPGFASGKTIVIGSITAGDFVEWQESNDGPAKKNAGLKLIIRSLVDGIPGTDPGATGKRIGTDAGLVKLKEMPIKHTERIIRAIIELNGLNAKADGTSAVETAVKKD